MHLLSTVGHYASVPAAAACVLLEMRREELSIELLAEA